MDTTVHTQQVILAGTWLDGADFMTTPGLPYVFVLPSNEPHVGTSEVIGD